MHMWTSTVLHRGCVCNVNLKLLSMLGGCSKLSNSRWLENLRGESWSTGLNGDLIMLILKMGKRLYSRYKALRYLSDECQGWFGGLKGYLTKDYF